MLRRILYELTTTTDLRTFLLEMALAGIAGLLLTLCYYQFRDSRRNSIDLSRVLVPVALIMTFTTVIISSSVSLAVGLVGTLSIIRFRLRTAGPEPILYLLAAIGLGVAAALDFFLIGAIGLTLFILVMAGQDWFRRKKLSNILLTVESKSGLDLPALSKILPGNGGQTERPQFREISQENHHHRIVISLKNIPLQELQALKTELLSQFPSARIRIEDDPA